ncbi:matrixin family metalloprotease [Lentilactobacillus sp. IMAU92037]|uniref:matrixin family metalloprotease n=1 Tax=Lentilactobacillus dabitei TaxID=2831523 RepID=UPI001C2B9F52|nr:matrixin family metalloprotease [Lentilactobacillus dabitei]MBV0930762.1 matrixin family metalloprotease [Lentilactobacillus dabitei]
MTCFKNQFLLLIAAFSFGALLTSQATTTVDAKAQSAKVISEKKMPVKAYHAHKGYIYSNATLTKIKHNAKNYPRTTFYAQKRVTVKQANGKKAVYYYVNNRSKSVRGYIWHGYLKSISTTSATKAKPMSQKSLVKLINEAPDMNPDSQIRSLKKVNYVDHENVFDLGYNVMHFSPRSMFKNNQATVYVPSDKLTGYAQNAMNKWNDALGTTVFKMGTKTNHTLTIQFGNGTKEDWDGLYNGKAIYVDKSYFADPKYPIGYMDEKLAAQISIDQYWTGVIAHELGHTLGLDHTGYQEDLMYAQDSGGNVIAKYTWKKPVVKSSTGLDGTEMATVSERDLNRAKLTKILGYW